jgi:hypothetical protein
LVKALRKRKLQVGRGLSDMVGFAFVLFSSPRFYAGSFVIALGTNLSNDELRRGAPVMFSDMPLPIDGF